MEPETSFPRHHILADIWDAEAIDTIIASIQPTIIFHAAALKHLPLLERFPDEAFNINVQGARNHLTSASRNNVTHFVNISFDNVADPSKVLGKSKLHTEQLTASIPSDPNRTYASVRFGNVLGSRGSVIETFRFQIEHGGPVTVTDESVTQFLGQFVKLSTWFYKLLLLAITERP